MIVDNLEPHQQSISPIDCAPLEASGIESSESITWCHRDYGPKRLVAIGNAFGRIGLMAVIVLPVAALFYGWSTGVFGPWKAEECFRIAVTCVFLNPAMWVICLDGLNSFAKPLSIKVTKMGLEANLAFGVRQQAQWKDVRVKLVKGGSHVRVELASGYKFTIQDDYDQFEQIRDILCELASDVDASLSVWSPNKVEPSVIRISPFWALSSRHDAARPARRSRTTTTTRCPIDLPPLSRPGDAIQD